MPEPSKLPVVDEYELANLDGNELEKYLKKVETQLNNLLTSLPLYGG